MKNAADARHLRIFFFFLSFFLMILFLSSQNNPNIKGEVGFLIFLVGFIM